MKMYEGYCPNCSDHRTLFADCNADELEVFCEDCEINFYCQAVGEEDPEGDPSSV